MNMDRLANLKQQQTSSTSKINLFDGFGPKINCTVVIINDIKTLKDNGIRYKNQKIFPQRMSR